MSLSRVVEEKKTSLLFGDSTSLVLFQRKGLNKVINHRIHWNNTRTNKPFSKADASAACVLKLEKSALVWSYWLQDSTFLDVYFYIRRGFQNAPKFHISLCINFSFQKSSRDLRTEEKKIAKNFAFSLIFIYLSKNKQQLLVTTYFHCTIFLIFWSTVSCWMGVPGWSNEE